MLKPISPQRDFPQAEREILKFWDEHQIFKKLMEKNRGRKTFSFLDGPITANNPMGVHHAWGRTYKDLYQRYRAMRGYDQRYQNGFDCQGLWVEVGVEKELGFTSKRDIERYGLDKFSERCRERVTKYSQVIADQSKRLGQWMDWDNSYYTMTDENIEYIWTFLQRCHEGGWLDQSESVRPWCVRCGTGLSQHELTDSYVEIAHPSVYLKLPILERKNEYFLVWTTTPWTLTSNVALAVNPEAPYVKVRQDSKIYYLSQDTLGCLSGDHEILEEVKGSDLVGCFYRGPFDHLPVQGGVRHQTVPWADVEADEGTGIVHTAPGCGPEDHALSRQFGLAVIAPLDENGYFIDGFGWLSGKHVQKVASPIIEDLKQRGLLYKEEEIVHRYPVCWRCHEEIVYRLVRAWDISVDELRPRLIEEAKKVEWDPPYAGKLMEDWLKNMGNWCISRSRFWGLPLPFYPCDCGNLIVIGSKEELRRRAVEYKDVELHRPWIDEIKIRCDRCGREVSRVPGVGDCWLDAGIVPYSTLGYIEDKERWEKWFPADLVIEMREQIRLWFYSMLFMSVVLEGRAPYQKGLVYEKVNDEEGRPMHKSFGNVIWFDEAVKRIGADVMRWLYCSHDRKVNLNFGYGPAEKVKRRLMLLWNAYSFFVTYAQIDQPDLGVPEHLPPNTLDRWALSRLNQMIATVEKGLDGYDAAAATGAIEAFVEDLTNWYIRRSRRRFWKANNDQDKREAYYTLHKVLITLAKVIAPLTPFLAEDIYQNLRDGAAPESVHLCDYPVPEPVDEKLLEQMARVRKIVEMGHALRMEEGIKVRQPLGEMYAEIDGEPLPTEYRGVVLEELNVKRFKKTSGMEREEEGCRIALNVRIGKVLKLEGLAREIVRRVQDTRKRAGYRVDDTIVMMYETQEEVMLEAIKRFGSYIAGETLSSQILEGISSEDLARDFVIDGKQIRLGVKRRS